MFFINFESLGAMVSSTYQLTKFKLFEESIAKLFWSTNTKNMSPDFVFFVRQIFVLDWLMTLVFSTYQLSFGKFLLPNFLRAFAVAKKSSNFVFFVGTRTPLVELVEIHHTEKNSRGNQYLWDRWQSWDALQSALSEQKVYDLSKNQQKNPK